jgi:hypothetical protein
METLPKTPPPEDDVFQPWEELSNVDSFESIENSHSALQNSFERFAAERGADAIESNYSLLEDIGVQDSNEEKPDCTVCVPIAIMGEGQESVLSTVGSIKRAQQSSGRPVELVLWANAKRSVSSGADNAEIDTVSRDRYETLKTELAGLAGDGLRIRTALQINDPDTTISEVRANYMDAVAMQAVQKGYGYEHPVIWLDADTTALSKNALKDLADGVRKFDSKFVHADSRWSVDWADRPLAEQDDATKAVALNEIRRRQLVRMNKSEHVIQGAYTEEWGLAFAMGTYLEAGGVDTSDASNESMNLILRAQRSDSANMPGRLAIEWRNLPPVVTLPGVKLSTSARGFYDAVQKGGLEALPAFDSNINSQNGMFTETDELHNGVARVFDANDVRDTLRDDFGKVSRMERRPSRFGYETSEQVVAAWGLSQAAQDRLVKRYFEESHDTQQDQS